MHFVISPLAAWLTEASSDDLLLATEVDVMNDRPLAATRRRRSTVGTTVLVVAFIVAGGQTIALAKAGEPSTSVRPSARHAEQP